MTKTKDRYLKQFGEDKWLGPLGGMVLSLAFGTLIWAVIIVLFVVLVGCSFGPCVTEWHPFSHTCIEPRD